ncbi:MAG: SGNH/GDSL hydrolase family protein [Bacteroidota bacterium]
MNKPALSLLAMLWLSVACLFSLWFFNVRILAGNPDDPLFELEMPPVAELFAEPGSDPASGGPALMQAAALQTNKDDEPGFGNGQDPTGSSLAADSAALADSSAALMKSENLSDSVSDGIETQEFVTRHLAMATDQLGADKVDSSSQHILLIGDSMAECLYFPFLKYAKYSRHKITGRFWYGSNTTNWAAKDTLRKVIRRHKPSLVMFSLGANELFIQHIRNREKFLKRILAQMDSTPYIFIGPPNWKKDTGFNDMVMDNVPADQFFLSANIKLDRRKDGAHPTMDASKIWADTLANWMSTRSRYRILIRKNAPPKQPGKSDESSAKYRAEIQKLKKENGDLASIKSSLETKDKDIAWLRKELLRTRAKVDSIKAVKEGRKKTVSLSSN